MSYADPISVSLQAFIDAYAACFAPHFTWIKSNWHHDHGRFTFFLPIHSLINYYDCAHESFPQCKSLI